MDSQCNYFVVRKKRLCRMTVRPGEKYCGEHQPQTNIENSSENAEESNATKNENKRRIPCPLDPKHTCFASKLVKHLQVCNARIVDLPPYIVKNCNVSEDTDENCSIEKIPLSEVSENELARIIAIIEKMFNDVIADKISKLCYTKSHPNVEEELNNKLRADSSKRHLVQTSSLLNIIESNHFLTADTCFVELGAGRGQVSYYLATSASKISNCSVLLIDRASHRHKQDNKLDKDNHNVVRVRADISDLLLEEVPVVKSAKNIVGVSKHLCGVATDLALKCITKSTNKTKGIVMATCCHHRCVWGSYVGKDFLQEHNVTFSDFRIICGLVSWATCGSGISRKRRAEIKSDVCVAPMKKAKYESDNIISNETTPLVQNYDKNEFIENDDEFNKAEEDDMKHKTEDLSDKINNKKHLGLTSEERAEIGFKAKALLDWGRVMYLRSKDFDTKLHFYVDKSVSPENVCIVANKNEILYHLFIQ